MLIIKTKNIQKCVLLFLNGLFLEVECSCLDQRILLPGKMTRFGP